MAELPRYGAFYTGIEPRIPKNTASGRVVRRRRAGPAGPKREGCMANYPICPRSPSTPLLRYDNRRGVP